MTETSSSIGIVVTAEQIPLLRDIIGAHALDVYISDTQDTLLLDDQWKPWIRRVKPQRAHCMASVWLIAPCYSWPDQHSHPRIRQIIAEQLHSCIQMAVMLGATGLVLPVEHALPALRDRISYYIELIYDQLRGHELALMIAPTTSADVTDVISWLNQSGITCPILIETHDTHQYMDDPDDIVRYAQITSDTIDDTHALPTWTNHYVVSANEHVSLIRKKILWLHEHIALQQQPTDESVPPAESEAQSLVDSNKEIT